MDILESNITRYLPQIQDDIKNCYFAAIDFEFSGLDVRSFDLLDTREKRYLKLRQNVIQYFPIQFGLSLFFYNETYTCNSYQFYLFPHKVKDAAKAKDRTMHFYTSNFKFLSHHGFDFNKWITDGVNYMNLRDLKSMLDKTYDENVKSFNHDGLKNLATGDQEFVESFLVEFQDFVLDDKKKIFYCSPNSKYQKKLIHDILSREYNYLRFIISDNKSKKLLKIEKMSEQEIEDKDKECITKVTGFSQIIQLLIDRKVPIVGHNMFIDLLFMVHYFIHHLPEKYQNFKNLVRNHFTLLFDTKQIVKQLFKNFFTETDLNEIYLRIKEPPFQFISVDSKPLFLDELFHQAGYDSYITGVVFINFLHQLSPMARICDPKIKILSGIIPVSGIHDIKEFKIFSKEIEPCRKNAVYVQYVNNKKNVENWLSKYKYKWIQIDEKSAFVIFNENTSVRKVIEDFRQSVNLNEIQMELYQNINAKDSDSENDNENENKSSNKNINPQNIFSSLWSGFPIFSRR